MNICTDNAKAMVSEISGTLTGIWTVTPNCIVFFTTMHLPFKQKPVSHKNVLDEAVTIINFVKSQPWSTCFLIWCGTGWAVHIENSCTVKDGGFLQENSWCAWVVSRAGPCCPGIAWKNNGPLLTQTWVFKTFSWKWSEPITLRTKYWRIDC